MEDQKQSHIVEIPIDEEHKQNQNQNQKQLCVVMEHHPFTEISNSPGHLLLLKLWQREEHLFARRISLKETRIQSSKRQIFNLSCFFFIFHALLFTVLFTSSLQQRHRACRKWWIPAFVSLATSSVMVILVQVKVMRYWKVWNELQRERSDGRGMTRCIQELRMKGSSFDLSRETQRNGKRLKSSSVEIKWKPISWCCNYLVTICLVGFAGLAFPASKLILCTI